MSSSPRAFRLIISCPDKPGIVAAVSNFIAQQQGNIIEANHYSDLANDWFFMRHVIAADSLPATLDQFQQAFRPIAEQFDMRWEIRDASKKRRVLLMVSKQDHCLSDLLYRWKSGEMDFDIPCVISNHEDLRDYVEWHGIPYVCIPVPRGEKGKQQAFAKTDEVIAKHRPDTIVLARYMQIIPPWMCERYPNQIINIHHSFLPSFAGAKPYHQAKERGVKLTGATSHYVTKDLDAGPIIEQDVIRISHHDSIAETIRLGKDVEKSVLARALRYHLEDRVLVHGNKTIVFS